VHILFDPPHDYGGIAKSSAGSRFGGLDAGIFAGRACTVTELKELLEEALQAVQGGRGAMVEVVLRIGIACNWNTITSSLS
jgi:hypothetical protein